MQLFKSFLLFMSLVISDVVRVGGLLFAVNYFQNFTIFLLLILTNKIKRYCLSATESGWISPARGESAPSATRAGGSTMPNFHALVISRGKLIYS